MAATVAGTAALTGLGLWLQRTRETDLRSTDELVTNLSVLGIPDGAPGIRFAEVAASAGIRMRHGSGQRSHSLPEDTGPGLAWGDVEGDGDLDLFMVNMAPLTADPSAATGADAGNKLYLNQGDGRFEEAAAERGVADGEGIGMGASFADYDGDGDADLYVTRLGANRLYRNRGDGRFDEVAAAAGVADERWSTGAAWGDYDRDGHLDLYVANYVAWDEDVLSQAQDLHTEFPFTLNPNSFPAQPNALFHNRGDGSFEEVARAAGVSDPDGRGLNAVFCDLDEDGWLDLYVANDTSPNRLFLNRGAAADGPVAFEDRSAATGMADTRSGMGVTVADLAGEGGLDGWPDLFVGNWVAQDNALFRAVVYQGKLLEYHDDARVHGLAEVSTAEVSWGTAAADLDLDGRPELVVVNGSTLQQPDDPLLLRPEKTFVFWNDGERFYDVAPAAGPALARAYNGRGLAAADYDRDGDVDLAVAVNRGTPLLLRNDTVTGHKGLAVALKASDALRFGARIRVTVRGVTQDRWFGGDASYLSGHAPDLPFGLGDAAQADRVEVIWADGRRSEREGVPAGRVVLAP